MDPQARPGFPLSFGYTHGSDRFKVMDVKTGRVVHSRDVTWHQPRELLVSPAPTTGSECSIFHPVPKRVYPAATCH